MYKFVVLSVVALVACVSGAPGGVVVASAPGIALAHPVHPVATSYSSSYRSHAVKAVPVIAAAPVVAVHAPVVKSTHHYVAHAQPTLVRTAPLVAHAPIAVAHSAPLLHAAPITAVHSVPVVKTHLLAAPVTLVH